MSTLDPALSSLAFLYLTFSHSTDGELGMDEMRTLGKKMQEWAPDAPLADVGAVIKSAVGEYQATAADKRLAEAQTRAAKLASFANLEARSKIVNDLEAIAKADGDVSPAEVEFINELKEVLGL